MPEGGDALPQLLAVASTSATQFIFQFGGIYRERRQLAELSQTWAASAAPRRIAITVSVNASTLLAGTYSGEIVFEQYSQQDMALTVPVTSDRRRAGSTAFFDSLPGQMSFPDDDRRAAPAAQAIQIRNAGTGALHWTLSTNTADGGKWLTRLRPERHGAFHGERVDHARALPSGGLAAGTFNGQIVLQTTGDEVTIPSASPWGPVFSRRVNAINFTMPQGGGNPLPQILAVSSTGAELYLQFGGVYRRRR